MTFTGSISLKVKQFPPVHFHDLLRFMYIVIVASHCFLFRDSRPNSGTKDCCGKVRVEFRQEQKKRSIYVWCGGIYCEWVLQKFRSRNGIRREKRVGLGRSFAAIVSFTATEVVMQDVDRWLDRWIDRGLILLWCWMCARLSNWMRWHERHTFIVTYFHPSASMGTIIVHFWFHLLTYFDRRTSVW